MPRPEEPTWHPISALPMVGSVITGMLEGAEDQAHLLLEAEEHSYALDDATVARLIRVYSEQAADHWLFEEQLRRWGAGPLSPEQRQEVERLSQAAARLKQVTTAILLMGRGAEVADHRESARQERSRGRLGGAAATREIARELIQRAACEPLIRRASSPSPRPPALRRPTGSRLPCHPPTASKDLLPLSAVFRLPPK